MTDIRNGWDDIIQFRFVEIQEESIKTKVQELNNCYHCGESCETNAFTDREKKFCCAGCKMVYAVLQENGLSRYYELNPAAGMSQKAAGKLKYGFLDDPLTVQKLISYQDDRRIQLKLYIPGIHCSSCLWLLENLPKLNDHVESCRVDFIKKEARISFFHEGLSLRQVVELLDKIGYPPHIIFKDLDSQLNRPVSDKSLYYKLGLAGFAFGNIMLFSFPEYLGLTTETDGRIATIFSYLNVALIIPVLLYSGGDYFHSAWQGLRKRHLNIDVPVSLGILALFLRSLFEIFTHTGAGYIDSLAGLIFFLLVGKWFQQKTFARISFDRDFKSYFPIACSVLKNGTETQVTLDQLLPGDTLIIRHGELIPADSQIENGIAEIDYSFVTGEEEPIQKEKGALVYAGGRQMGALVTLKVLKTVSNSYLTQLWNDKAFNKEAEKGQTSIIADRVARFFTFFILIVAFGALFFWLPTDVSTAINAFTAVLIVACPCAVALSIPFSFGNAIRILASKGIYLRNSQVIEILSRIDALVFDKTGTITNVRKSTLRYQGIPLDDETASLVYSLSRHSTHPISRMIEKKLRHCRALEVHDYLEEKGKGISGLVQSQLVRLGSKEFFGEDLDVDHLDHDDVIVAINDTVYGSFRQENRYRKGLAELIRNLSAKYTLALLTGDNQNERAHIEKLFGRQTDIRFRQKPEDKLHYIRMKQEKGHHLAMIGDGLNDAGALKESELGIVISEDTSNFTPACDIVMDARQFERLESLFDYAHDCIRVVYMAYAIALVYNIIGLSFAVQALLSPVIAAILMPLSSVSIVLFGLGMTGWYARRYGFLFDKPGPV